jgi:hypothetical protein
MTYIAEALRQQINEQAQRRCEYCRLHEDFAYHRHEIDHIYAEKHGGATQADNLCVTCADCNRHKGSNLCSLDPDTGMITALFHPRQDVWHEHFRMKANGIIEPLSAQGRVLRFNRLDLVVDRERLIKLGKY